jgi:hypothetical protein
MISTAKFKSWINEEDTVTTIFDDLISRVLSGVQGLTGRRLDVVDSVTKYIDGSGVEALHFPDLVTDLSSVIIEYRSTPNGSFSVVDSSGYVTLNRENPVAETIALASSTWNVGVFSYKLTYNTGYAVDTGPGDLLMFFYETCSILYASRVKSLSSIPISIEDISSRFTFEKIFREFLPGRWSSPDRSKLVSRIQHG